MTIPNPVLMGLAALVTIPMLWSEAASPAPVGEAAPNFSLKDANGQTHTLSDLKGKYVVLEWVNFGCPFVRKHYNSGNMSSLQKAYTAKNVVWLSICSSAPGKQGYFEGEELKAEIATMKAVPSAYLLDSDGTVGRLYAAKATPTMFVIDPKGTILYGGAIDNIPSTSLDDVPKARNYVKEALDLALAGKSVEITSSKAYGCSVKYKD
jgi:peroxiredoxin